MIVRVNGNLERYEALCAEASVAGRFGEGFVMPYEKRAPIVVCRGLRRVREMWGDFVFVE